MSVNRIISGMFLASLVVILATAFYPEEAETKTSRLITLSFDNTVLINLPIDTVVADRAIRELQEKSSNLSKSSPIYLVLNTPGGSVQDGMRIIDAAQGLPQKVHTVTLFAASMGFITAQYLDKRYVTETGTMMSHRMRAEGIGGEVPGNLIARALMLLNMAVDIDEKIAHRAQMDRMYYEKLIANELWMSGIKSVEMKFADDVVRLRCDKSLRGPGKPINIQVFMFSATIAFDKCPLISAPTVLSVQNNISAEAQRKLHQMLYDRASYAKEGEGK